MSDYRGLTKDHWAKHSVGSKRGRTALIYHLICITINGKPVLPESYIKSSPNQDATFLSVSRKGFY